MKRFTFHVQDNVTRRISVIAGNINEAKEKLEDYDIEDECEQQCDMDFEGAELVDEEDLDDDEY